jgi:hypothetical protein
MITEAVGTARAISSVVAMPSMSGMLMSMRTMSGVSLVASLRASTPDAAAPTTSMSPSKPRSFERWSRVSGMSSTIRTRIWSAI